MREEGASAWRQGPLDEGEVTGEAWAMRADSLAGGGDGRGHVCMYFGGAMLTWTPSIAGPVAAHASWQAMRRLQRGAWVGPW